MNLTRRCFFNEKLSILSYLHQRNGYTDKKENIPVKMIMEELGIKNKTQIDTWWHRYRNGENHRLIQPVGKQYDYGKDSENLSNEQQLKNENNYLKMHIEVLKKFKEFERTWSQKYL